MMAALIAEALLQLLHGLVDGKSCCPLAWRILLEGLQKPAHRGLRSIHDKSVVDDPVPVGVGRDVRAFVRIGPQVKHLADAKSRERFGPDEQRTRGRSE